MPPQFVGGGGGCCCWATRIFPWLGGKGWGAATRRELQRACKKRLPLLRGRGGAAVAVQGRGTPPAQQWQSFMRSAATPVFPTKEAHSHPVAAPHPLPPSCCTTPPPSRGTRPPAQLQHRQPNGPKPPSPPECVTPLFNGGATCPPFGRGRPAVAPTVVEACLAGVRQAAAEDGATYPNPATV